MDSPDQFFALDEQDADVALVLNRHAEPVTASPLVLFAWAPHEANRSKPQDAVGVLVDMDTNLLKAKFEKLGAKAKIRPLARNRWRPDPGRVVIDVRHDRHGEFFDIQADSKADVQVLDVQPRDRHLLLMVRHPADRTGLADTKENLLCGHDERHWFIQVS